MMDGQALLKHFLDGQFSILHGSIQKESMKVMLLNNYTQPGFFLNI